MLDEFDYDGDIYNSEEIKELFEKYDKGKKGGLNIEQLIPFMKDGLEKMKWETAELTAA